MCSTAPEGGTLVVNNVKSSHEQVECCTKADSAAIYYLRAATNMRTKYTRTLNKLLHHHTRTPRGWVKVQEECNEQN